MSESDTQLIAKASGNGSPDSQFFGVSVRAWLAMLPIIAIVITQLTVVLSVTIDAVFFSKDWSKVGTFANIPEPLNSISIGTIAYYFGQKTAKTT